MFNDPHIVLVQTMEKTTTITHGPIRTKGRPKGKKNQVREEHDHWVISSSMKDRFMRKETVNHLGNFMLPLVNTSV